MITMATAAGVLAHMALTGRLSRRDAWLAAGGQPRDAGTVVQQCGVGLVRVRRDGARLAFAAPPLRRDRSRPHALAFERLLAVARRGSYPAL